MTNVEKSGGHYYEGWCDNPHQLILYYEQNLIHLVQLHLESLDVCSK